MANQPANHDFDMAPKETRMTTPPKPPTPPRPRTRPFPTGVVPDMAAPIKPPSKGPQPSTARARHEKRGRNANRTVNKTRNGGGFNPALNVTPSINITKVVNPGPGAAGSTAGPGAGAGTTPGSGFMSNEDIHKFAEYIRKEGRKRAGERAMDAEQLEQVLRHIPDTNGSLVGARIRARRVSRHLKRIAKGEQLIAKEATALYAAFEREYEAELRKVGRGRAAQPRPSGFAWRS